MSRRGAAALLLALVLAVAVTVPARAWAGSIGGFGAFPVRGAHGTTAPYFRRTLRRGGQTVVRAVVENSSAHAIPIAVTPVAGLTGQTSGAVYGNVPRSRDHGLAVVPGQRDFVLPAHSRRRVAIRVRVTRRAGTGDHLAGVAFVDRHHSRSRGRFAVTEIVRVVLGLSVRVPGSAHLGVRVGRLSAESLGGTPDAALRVPITNVGGLYCRPRVAVRLDRHGRNVQQTRALDTILPHTGIDYPLPWGRVMARGTYAAQVAVSGCGITVRRRQTLAVSVSRPPARPAPPSPTPAPAPTRVVVHTAPHGGTEWPLLAVVGLGGLGLGLLASRRRRRRDPPPGPPSPSPAGSVS